LALLFLVVLVLVLEIPEKSEDEDEEENENDLVVTPFSDRLSARSTLGCESLQPPLANTRARNNKEFTP
jgi:hypothetical protein